MCAAYADSEDIASFEEEAWYADVCVGGVKVAALAFRLLSAPLTLVSTAMGAMMDVIWGAGYRVGCVVVLSFGRQYDKKNVNTCSGMGIKSKRCSERRQKGKVTGGMVADLLYHTRIISKRGSQNHMPGGLMGRYPPIAANERYLMLVPALKERGWLFLRLGAKRMVQPALRGILMTYINA